MSSRLFTAEMSIFWQPVSLSFFSSSIVHHTSTQRRMPAPRGIASQLLRTFKRIRRLRFWQFFMNHQLSFSIIYEYKRCDLGHRAWPGALMWAGAHVRDLALPCDLFLPLCRLWDIWDMIQVFGDLVIQNKLKLRHYDLIWSTID